MASLADHMRNMLVSYLRANRDPNLVQRHLRSLSISSRAVLRMEYQRLLQEIETSILSACYHQDILDCDDTQVCNTCGAVRIDREYNAGTLWSVKDWTPWRF